MDFILTLVISSVAWVIICLICNSFSQGMHYKVSPTPVTYLPRYDYYLKIQSLHDQAIQRINAVRDPSEFKHILALYDLSVSGYAVVDREDWD